MSNNIRQEMSKIEIPKGLSERSKMGVSQAKKEMKRDRKRFNIKGIGIIAAIIMSIGVAILFINSATDNQNKLVVHEDGSVEIPTIQLPDDSSDADMIGLIVYNNKIYTQTTTKIDPKDAGTLLGEKLGKTKASINEWSKQKAYDTEFASSIGENDIYAVKGYDKDFRIMSYGKIDDELYAEFYESLNGITINSGEDLFGKLNLVGNVSSAQYRTFSDWNYDVNNFKAIVDMEVLNGFLEELNRVKPLVRTQQSDPISNARNNEDFRELTIDLYDSSMVELTLLRDGYIYYGDMDVYFQMDEDVFSIMWSQLE